MSPTSPGPSGAAGSGSGSGPDRPTASEEFLRLFAETNHRIYAFIVTLLPGPGEADDVFQRTSVVLWRKFAEFRPETGTDFVRWACRIAQLEVMNHRRSRQRDRLQFDDRLIAQLADDRLEHEGLLRARTAALAGCLQRLGEGDRSLLKMYYDAELTMPEIAERLGRPANTLYKAINRVRRALRRCIDARLAAEGWA
jgi:RNA polymerase sigma-70 factor (ECF subfamily)